MESYYFFIIFLSSRSLAYFASTYIIRALLTPLLILGNALFYLLPNPLIKLETLDISELFLLCLNLIEFVFSYLIASVCYEDLESLIKIIVPV